METILANVNGKVRRETLNGREYLVASATLLAQGVLNGSKGALYYPSEEISKNFDAWNGMPLVANHPVRVVDGEEVHVSARDPEILAEQGIGFVYRVSANGRLSGEAWFDEALTKNYDKKLPAEQQIVPRLLRGESLEISTGLYTENEPAPADATYNGTPYAYIARNYKPDHLAVLPADKGACSVQDGCGVLVNEDAKGLLQRFIAWMAGGAGTQQQPTSGAATVSATTNSGEEAMLTREQTISWLTTNCDCWKEGDGKATLNKLSDKQLAGLKATVEAAGKYTLVLNKARKAVIGNAEGETEGEAAGVDIAALAEFLQITTDPAKDPVAFVEEIKTKLSEVLGKLGGKPAAPEPEKEPAVMEEGGAANEEEDEEEKKRKAAAVTNRRPAKPLTDQEWLKQAPPSVRSAVANAIKIEANAKRQIVQRLTANLDEERARPLQARLMKKDLVELEELALLAPAPREEEEPLTANYLGAGGAPVSSYRDDSQNLLPEFSVNRAELRQQKA